MKYAFMKVGEMGLLGAGIYMMIRGFIGTGFFMILFGTLALVRG